MKLIAALAGTGAVVAAGVGIVYGIPITGPLTIVLALIAAAAYSETGERPYDWRVQRDL